MAYKQGRSYKGRNGQRAGRRKVIPLLIQDAGDVMKRGKDGLLLKRKIYLDGYSLSGINRNAINATARR